MDFNDISEEEADAIERANPEFQKKLGEAIDSAFDGKQSLPAKEFRQWSKNLKTQKEWIDWLDSLEGDELLNIILEKNPELQKEIEQGQKEYEAGLVKIFTKEELKKNEK